MLVMNVTPNMATSANVRMVQVNAQSAVEQLLSKTSHFDVFLLQTLNIICHLLDLKLLLICCVQPCSQLLVTLLTPPCCLSVGSV